MDRSLSPHVVVVPVRTAHWFHLAMSAITFGLWLPLYLVAVISNINSTTTKTVWPSERRKP